MFHYLATTIQEHQIKPKPTWFNPAAPYLNIFPLLMDERFTESDMWYLWCVTALFKYPVIFPTFKAIEYFMSQENQNTLLWKFLSWYSPIHWWKEQIDRDLNRFNIWKLDEEQANKFVSIFTIHRPYFKHPNGCIYTQNQSLAYATFPDLKTFMKPDNPPFWKEELTLHLHEINGFKVTQKQTTSSCNKLKNLDLICSPDWEVSPEFFNEDFKEVKMKQLPPKKRRTPISESNLLWQNWEKEKTEKEELFWNEEVQQKDKSIWQDSQDPCPP